MMYLLVAVIFTLVLIIFFQNIKINKISAALEEVIKGNFNGRVRLRDYNKSVRKLIININRLIDEFQKVGSLNNQYEEDRKKMISNISHDFRTPLTSMLGYIEMLKNDDELSQAERQEYLDIISSKGEILRELIEEFFSLSKLDSEDIIFQPKKINIGEVIRQSILSFIKDFETNKISPIVDIPEKDIFIDADERAIFRILQNLISNSLRHGSEGNVIGISLKETINNISIETWDNGKGIASEEIPYIFKRLYTVEKSRNNKLKGSGIGLTIVQKLVEKHNGTINVNSIPYEKTVFCITLPKKLRNM